MTNFIPDNLNKLPVNRFSAVMIAAKRARKINEALLVERKEDENQEEVKEPKPAGEALKALLKGEIRFQYPENNPRRKGR